MLNLFNLENILVDDVMTPRSKIEVLDLSRPIDDSTLSFSEFEAIIHIFDELDGDEGILVASKIADRVGITRSVIVNALRKILRVQV